MKCVTSFKDTTYGTDAYCPSCGMDLGLSTKKVKHKRNTYLVCCEDCAKLK